MGHHQQGGEFATPWIETGKNKFKAGGDGYFDILITFENSSGDKTAHFDGDGTEFIQIDWGRTAGLSASDFVDVSADGKVKALKEVEEPIALALEEEIEENEKGGLYSAAHIQGIAPSGSGWIATNALPPDGSVPEPGGLALAGLPLAALAAFRRRRA